MLALAIRNLLVRKARTALATAGLTIALLGIIALISVSAGIESLLAQTLRLLPGIMVLRRDVPIPTYSTLDEGLLPKIEAVPGVAQVIPQVFFLATVVEGRNLFLQGDPLEQYALVGVDAARVAQLPGGGLFARSLLRGRANRPGVNEVMVPKHAAEVFEKDVGDTINVLGHKLKITGVFEIGSLLLDRGFIIPIELCRKIKELPEGQVSAFYVELEPNADPDAVAREIDAAVPGVRARSTKDTTEEFKKVWRRVDLLLAAIAAIAVLVGAVGIVNTMLMSVIERTRELGVLRAVGWRRRDVVRLIVTESALLGVLGGAIGTSVGSVGVYLASLFLPLQPVASPGLLFVSFALAVVLGTFGGLYPAWRAAGLNPIEAIRA